MRLENLSTRQRICLAIAFFSFAVMLTGCATTWVSESVSIIQTLIPAITGILSLIAAFNPTLVDPAIMQTITTAATEVSNDLTNVVLPLINEYNAADPATRQTLLGKIQSALQVIESNWAIVLNSIHINDPATQAKVEAVVSLVGSEIAALINLIPALKLSAERGDTDMTKLLTAVRATGLELPLTAGQFKHAYNRSLKQKTGNAKLDAAAKASVLP